MNDKEYNSPLSERVANPSFLRNKQMGKTDRSDTLTSKGLEPEKMKGLIKMTRGYLEKISREDEEWATLSGCCPQDRTNWQDP